MRDRVDFLVDQGLAERLGKRVILARNLLRTLRHRELTAVGTLIQRQTGMVYRPLREGEPARGVYRRSIRLASGRFAMLDDGIGFSLLPWRPTIEPRLGQSMSGIMRGGSVTWQFQRNPKIAL
jgi:hypothetical protein